MQQGRRFGGKPSTSISWASPVRSSVYIHASLDNNPVDMTPFRTNTDNKINTYASNTDREFRCAFPSSTLTASPEHRQTPVTKCRHQCSTFPQHRRMCIRTIPPDPSLWPLSACKFCPCRAPIARPRGRCGRSSLLVDRTPSFLVARAADPVITAHGGGRNEDVTQRGTVSID